MMVVWGGADGADGFGYDLIYGLQVYSIRG